MVMVTIVEPDNGVNLGDCGMRVILGEDVEPLPDR
jgi:hypothetical protein